MIKLFDMVGKHPAFEWYLRMCNVGTASLGGLDIIEHSAKPEVGAMG
jgi:hypothetical protein